MAKNSAQFQLIGDKELIAAFQELATRAKGEIVSRAVRNAARPIVNAAKSYLREQDSGNKSRGRTYWGEFATQFTKNKVGNLRRSIGSIVRRYRTGTVLAVIGPRWPEGAHGHLVEFGTIERKTKGEGKVKAGVSRGAMPAKPFLRPAFDAFKGQALEIMARIIRNGMIAGRFKK